MPPVPTAPAFPVITKSTVPVSPDARRAAWERALTNLQHAGSPHNEHRPCRPLWLEVVADGFGLICLVAFLLAALYALGLLVSHPQWSTADPGTAVVDPCRPQWTEDARFTAPDTPECKPNPNKE